MAPEDEVVDLDSEKEDSDPGRDEVLAERQWFKEHKDKPDEELAAHLNGTEFRRIHIGKVESDIPRILFATEDHRTRLKASKDVWQNPVFLSYMKYEVLPFNVHYPEARKIRSRAKSFRWSHRAKLGEHLLYLHRNQSNRVYPAPSRRPALLLAAHAEAHQQSVGMIAKLGRNFFWYQMREDIQSFTRQCEICQEPRTLQTADREMVPIPPGEKGMRWHLDLVGPLPTGSGGERFIAVAIDSCTKWPEAAPMKSKSPLEVETFFYRDVVCRHPVEEVVTDNGSEFLADFQRLCVDLGIMQIKTAVYHPQANGKVERFNATLKQGLFRLTKDHPNSWPYLIPRVLRSARATTHHTTGITPSYYLMGVELPPASLESIAWQPYVQPAAESGLPQGPQWYGKKVEKLFRDPVTGKLKLFTGYVDRLTITPEGQERLHTTYEDNDEDNEEVGNVLPWLIYPSGLTHLEETSRVDPTRTSSRIEHLLLTMLTYPTGQVSTLAKALIQEDPTYQPLLLVVPVLRSKGAALEVRQHLPAAPSAEPPQATVYDKRLQAHDKARLEEIDKRGKLRTARAQAKQSRAYAERKRPRNKRVERLAVEAHCKISKRKRASRSAIQAKTWEPELYQVLEIGPGSIKVFRRGDPERAVLTCLKEDVMPVFTPGLGSNTGNSALPAAPLTTQNLAGDNLEGPSNVPAQPE